MNLNLKEWNQKKKKGRQSNLLGWWYYR